MKSEDIAKAGSETAHQKALFNEAAKHYSIFPELRMCMFAIPNGGKRDPREAAHMKAQGVTAGVFDIFLGVAKKGYNGFFIEMKAPGKLKNTSEDQDKFNDAIAAQGYKTAVFDHWADAWSAIMDYMVD